MLGLLLLFPIMSAVIPDEVLARHLEQVAPMTAGLYVQATVGLDTLPLTPWQGLGITGAVGARRARSSARPSSASATPDPPAGPMPTPSWAC